MSDNDKDFLDSLDLDSENIDLSAAEFEVPPFNETSDAENDLLFSTPAENSASEPNMSFPDFTSDPFESQDPLGEKSNELLSGLELDLDMPSNDSSSQEISDEGGIELPSFENTFDDLSIDEGLPSATADQLAADMDSIYVEGEGEEPQNDGVFDSIEDDGGELDQLDDLGDIDALGEIDIPVPEEAQNAVDEETVSLFEEDAGSSPAAEESVSDEMSFDLPDFDDQADQESDVPSIDDELKIDLPVFGDESADMEVQAPSAEIELEENQEAVAQDEGLDLDLPDFDQEVSSEEAIDLPVFGDLGSDGNKLSLDEDEFKLPESNLDLSENQAAADQDMDLDLPDFGEESASDGDKLDLDLPDFGDESDSGADDFALPDLDEQGSESESPSMNDDFDLPDFDDEKEDDLSAGLGAAAGIGAVGISGIFDDDFGDVNLETGDSFLDDDDLGTADFGDTDFGSDGLSSSQQVVYDDLSDEEEDSGRKSKMPVMICIICACVCLIAALLIGIMVSKNVKNKSDKDSSQTTTVIAEKQTKQKKEKKNKKESSEELVQQEEAAPVEEQTPVAEEELVQETAEEQNIPEEENAAEPVSEPEEVAEEAAPEPAQVSEPETAEEDKIVIAAVPEAIVPVQPEKPANHIEDIKYIVKWGDTLWDIAAAYYKNPWRYITIANYNGLKNPDQIKAGSILLIPAE